MVNRLRAKDAEIYVFKMESALDVGTRGNNVSIGEFLDNNATGSDPVISSIIKLSPKSNEVSIVPQEDDTETKNYFGSTSSGAQNSYTSVTPNNEVDITLDTDTEIYDELIGFGLADQEVTHSDYADYKSFNLGSKGSDLIGVLIRVKRQIGSNYYYRNIVVLEPDFKSIPVFDASGDDSILTNSYELLANKGKVYLDFYSGTENEELTSFD